MNIKRFLIPDIRKLLVYLVFVLIFMCEILLIRSLYQQDYMVVFLRAFYNNFIKGKQSYINFFTVAFFYYFILLMILYLLSCLVILIYEKIEK
jgi:hypothetical protein